MDGQAIAVPTGGCCNLPQLSGRPPVCYSSNQGPVSSRLRSSENPTGTAYIGCRSERRVGGGAWVSEGRKKVIRNRTLRRVRLGSVVCSYGKAHDETRPEGGPLNSGTPHATRGRPGGLESKGDSYFFQQDSRERLRAHRDAYIGETRWYRNDDRSEARSLPDDSSWQTHDKHYSTARTLPDAGSWQGADRHSDSRRRTLQSAADRGGAVLDERLRTSSRRASTVQCIGEDGEETLEGSKAGGSTRILDQSGDEERTDLRNPIARQPILNIPRSEMMKIEELRFSGDLREGDSGPQVLNLQRALFWLGHLPGLSLSGYFGPETSRALQEFHASHGIPNSNVWGFQSQQALQKHLRPGFYRKEPIEETGALGTNLQKKPPQSFLAKSLPLAKNISGKVLQTGAHAGQVVQLWYSKTLPEFVTLVTSSSPHLTSISGKVGVVFLGFVVLSGIAKLWQSLFGSGEGQPVRRRVMSWRNDVSVRESTRKALQTRAGAQGEVKSFEGEDFMRKPRNRARSKSVDQLDEDTTLLDRLVLFEGQVLLADNPNNGKSPSSSAPGHEILSQSNTASCTAVQNKTSYSSRSKQPHGLGLEIGQRKNINGYDRYEKLEADPPRKQSAHQQGYMQRDSLARPSNREQVQSSRDYRNDVRQGWPTWLSEFVATIFHEKEGPYRPRRSSFRRAVKRSSSPERGKASLKVISADGKSLIRADRVDRGLAEDNEARQWKEEDELDLKRQIDELNKRVQAVDETRVAAMRALAEERTRSLELEVKINRQKEAAASLEEEVRVLKESHEALLGSLRKKYSSTAAARAAAALLHQNWDSGDSSARVSLPNHSKVKH